VRRYRSLKLAAEDFDMQGDDVLVGYERESGRNRFRAVRTMARLDDKTAYLPARAKQLLDAPAGARLSIIPFD